MARRSPILPPQRRARHSSRNPNPIPKPHPNPDLDLDPDPDPNPNPEPHPNARQAPSAAPKKRGGRPLSKKSKREQKEQQEVREHLNGLAEPTRAGGSARLRGEEAAAVALPSRPSRSHSPQEEEEEEEEEDNQKCESCGCGDDAGKIMLCDGCDKCYHIYCLPRPLLEVPG